MKKKEVAPSDAADVFEFEEDEKKRLESGACDLFWKKVMCQCNMM